MNASSIPAPDAPLHLVADWGPGAASAQAWLAQAAPQDRVIVLSKTQSARENVLPWRPWQTVGGLRRALLAQLGEAQPRLVCFHDGWGTDLFSDLFSAPRRLWFAHTPYPYFEHHLAHVLRYCHGSVFVQPGWRQAVLTEFTWIPERFVHLLPMPVAAVASPATRAPGESIVIGVTEPLRRRFTRIDRLIKFAEAMEVSGLAWQLEVTSEGPAEKWLRGKLAAYPQISFHPPTAFAQRVPRWDYHLFGADFAGLPPTLSMSLAAGAIPLYPDYERPGDLPGSLDARVLYPFGEPAAAVAQLQRWETAGEADKATFRQAATAHLAEDKPAQVREAWEDLVAHVAAQRVINPRVKPVSGNATFLGWHETLAHLRRYGRWGGW